MSSVAELLGAVLSGSVPDAHEVRVRHCYQYELGESSLGPEVVQFGVQVPASPVGPSVVLRSGEDVLSVVGVDNGETATGIGEIRRWEIDEYQPREDAMGSDIRGQLGTQHLEVAPVRVRSVVVSVRRVLRPDAVHLWVHVDEHDGVAVGTRSVGIAVVRNPVSVHIKLVVVESLAQGQGDRKSLVAGRHLVFVHLPSAEVGC